MIETFLLEQNLAKWTRQVWLSSDFRVRRHETTSRPADLWLGRKTQRISGTNQNWEWPLLFGTDLVRTCPQGLFSPYYAFLRRHFLSPVYTSLASRSAPGSPRMRGCLSLQILHRHCFQFLEKIKTMLMQTFWRDKQRVLWHFLYWLIHFTCDINSPWMLHMIENGLLLYK